MKLRRWLVVLALAVGALVMHRGCASRPDPDEEVVRHLDKLCAIARDNVGTPRDGVSHLGRYLGNHLDDILGAWGGTIGMIEMIPDDAEHDARAKLVHDRIVALERSCTADWKRFEDAVERDREAMAMIKRANERLGRTFDIIFGDHVELNDLPARLEQRLLPHGRF
jgi:hypothetical protein